MAASKVSVKAVALVSTDFYFLLRDGVLQRRFNEVKLVSVAKCMIITYFAVVLSDKDVIKIYRYQELVEQGGVGSLIKQNRRVLDTKNRVGEQTERVVVEYAVEFPAYGQARDSNQLRQLAVFISGSGVGSI